MLQCNLERVKELEDYKKWCEDTGLELGLGRNDSTTAQIRLNNLILLKRMEMDIDKELDSYKGTGKWEEPTVVNTL